MNLDDPKLTAFALGELSGPEFSAMESAVAQSPDAQTYVREMQQLARQLKQEFRDELEADERKPLNIMPLPAPRSFGSDSRWMSIGLAAVLAVSAVIAAITISSRRPPPVSSPVAATKPADIQMEVLPETPAEETDTYSAGLVYPRAKIVAKADATQNAFPTIAATALPRFAGRSDGDFNFKEKGFSSQFGIGSNSKTAEYDHFEENPFLSAASNPLSTFSTDVDTASYANVRRMLNSGEKPPKGAVRIEEMINYFTYDYPAPQPNEPFSVNLDLTGCPWQPEHRLVRIGLKAREVADEQRGASNLVFLLDVSGSMKPAERLPLVKQAMRLLVDRLTRNDHVAIVVYAGETGVALPSTAGDRKEEIIRALENLKAGGSTNGASGIELAYQIATENFIKGGINRVILATDGDFNVGVTSQDELVRLAEAKAKSGVFLSVLGVGTDNLRDSTMQKLADKGNGNYAYLDSLSEARKVLVQQMNSTLITVAKDVKVQVEFNPARVASYRLLGYEKRMLRKEDFNNDKIDAGEIGAGHTVTVLYEIVPAEAQSDPVASVPPVDPLKYQSAESSKVVESSELLTVKLRHKTPEGEQSKLTQRSLGDKASEFAQAPTDFRFAAAVAEFGMVLRDSPHKGNATLGAVLVVAEDAKGRDEAGYRAGFVELVRKAKALQL